MGCLRGVGWLARHGQDGIEGFCICRVSNPIQAHMLLDCQPGRKVVGGQARIIKHWRQVSNPAEAFDQ